MMSETEKMNKVLSLVSVVTRELGQLPESRSSPVSAPTGFAATDTGWLRFRWGGVLFQVRDTGRGGIEVEQVSERENGSGQPTAFSTLLCYYLRSQVKDQVRAKVHEAG